MVRIYNDKCNISDQERAQLMMDKGLELAKNPPLVPSLLNTFPEPTFQSADLPMDMRPVGGVHHYDIDGLLRALYYRPGVPTRVPGRAE